jgi:predicted O-methyltransferase YrrM
MNSRVRKNPILPYGPASDFIIEVLSEFKFYNDYASGAISQKEYQKAFDKNSKEIAVWLLGDEHLISLAREYPPDFDKHALGIFSKLVENGLLQEPDEDTEEPWRVFKKRVRRDFKHGRNHTFIQPDEARLLFQISLAKKPRSVIAVGSYYGYWAIWAMAGAYSVGGKMVLIDPNSKVCALAKSNFQSMRLGKFTKIFAEKAEVVLPKLDEQADLVLLDASGAQDSRNAEYRGKGIYSFLIEPIMKKIANGGILVVHNDTPSTSSRHPLSKFHTFCNDHFLYSFHAPTPEGIGVYFN